MFSVIIPNYNHAAFLNERIESILAQTLPPDEIIILDDCSTDHSREIIETYRGHKKISHIIYNDQNSGSPFKQWQKGIALAKADWIWIAESDDIADPAFLETASKAINDNANIVIFYCDAYIRTEGNSSAELQTFAALKNNFFHTQKWSSDYRNPGDKEINECLALQCTINNASSAVLRRDKLTDCFRQDFRFRFHGDWFCYLDMVKNAALYYHAQPLNTYRSHTSGIKLLLPEHGRNREECFRILDYILSELPINDKQKLLADFVNLHLPAGLWSGRKEIASYFRINKSLAIKVTRQLFRLRSNKGGPV